MAWCHSGGGLVIDPTLIAPGFMHTHLSNMGSNCGKTVPMQPCLCDGCQFRWSSHSLPGGGGTCLSVLSTGSACPTSYIWNPTHCVCVYVDFNRAHACKIQSDPKCAVCCFSLVLNLGTYCTIWPICIIEGRKEGSEVHHRDQGPQFNSDAKASRQDLRVNLK